METKSLYNQTARSWVRKSPNSLSDFTGRPVVFRLCGDVAGKHILDLGSGEGYCARFLASKGAIVHGLELSEEMVFLAQKQEEEVNLGISYEVGNITNIPLQSESFDLSIGVFVYNYLSIQDMEDSFQEVYRLLKPGGSFIFSVPHPFFAFSDRGRQPPFYFDTGEDNYYSGVNKLYSGKIFCLDGNSLDVQMIHKQLHHYLKGLNNAGFNKIKELVEASVSEEHLALNRNFFEPVLGHPLHLIFEVEKGKS
jgi:SAM-dependent methyltransferase